MINQLTTAIADQLGSTFGSGYGIHSEEAEQGFQKPCFFITLLNSSQTPMLGKKYQQKLSFGICYFPESAEKPVAEMMDIGETLYTALEFITVEGVALRGAGMHFAVAAGVLNFFIEYSLCTMRQTEETQMGELDVVGGIKQ